MLPGSIPDPFHVFMKWIRILQKEVDPGGSRFTTLPCSEDAREVRRGFYAHTGFILINWNIFEIQTILRGHS